MTQAHALKATAFALQFAALASCSDAPDSALPGDRTGTVVPVSASEAGQAASSRMAPATILGGSGGAASGASGASGSVAAAGGGAARSPNGPVRMTAVSDAELDSGVHEEEEDEEEEEDDD